MVPRRIKRLEKYLEPLIKDRLEQLEQHGDDWPDKPVSHPPLSPLQVLSLFLKRTTP